MSNNPRAPSSASSVQAVDRAITVLELLARRDEAGVTEIAAELGVHKSTASRLVSALAARGLVEQKRKRGRYRLGFELIRLGGANRLQPDLIQLAMPVCEHLAEEVRETVNIAVHESSTVVNVAQVRGPRAVLTQNWIGRHTPLHATSSGKVFLAFADARDREAITHGELARYTATTLSDPEQLNAELSQVAEQGYAFAHEELEVGLNAVAAPVRAGDQSVTFAVSVSGPSYRLVANQLPETAKHVVDAASEISWLLGHLSE